MAESSFISNFKYYIAVILFVVVLILSLKYIGRKYSAASTENLINTYNEKRFEEFYSLPENTLDMIFIGSSHSYCTFDPEIFDERLGTNSFQMGMPLQFADSTYYTLEEILNYQKPNTVVFEVYWGVLNDDFELKQATMLFQVLKNKELEKRYIEDVFPLSEKIKYKNNIFKYQADYFAFRNSELQKDLEEKFNVSKEVKERQVGTEEYRSKGYTYCDYKMLSGEFDETNQFKGLDGNKVEISKVQKKYMQNIVDFCKDENINLVMVTAPIANVSMTFIENYDFIHNEIQSFADANELPYIDYNIINVEEKLLTHDNFRDDAHLNHSGVEIVDNHFIENYRQLLVE